MAERYDGKVMPFCHFKKKTKMMLTAAVRYDNIISVAAHKSTDRKKEKVKKVVDKGYEL